MPPLSKGRFDRLASAGYSHAGRQLGKRERIAAEERQILDLFARDYLASHRVGRLEQRSSRGHGDLFGKRAHLERNVDCETVAHTDLDLLTLERRKALQRRGQRVSANRDERVHERALLVGDGRELRVRAFVLERHRDARQRGLLLIDDRAADGAAGFLCGGWCHQADANARAVRDASSAGARLWLNLIDSSRTKTMGRKFAGCRTSSGAEVPLRRAAVATARNVLTGRVTPRLGWAQAPSPTLGRRVVRAS